MKTRTLPIPQDPRRTRRLALLRRVLPRWYAEHRRDLPWRRTEDPYAIWVSEVMLQQTRVETVIPYFQRWMGEFPGIPELAGAPEERVLKAWEGLGYYRRARHLREAARILLENHGGRVPRDPEALRNLPGVGRSTAGAVASIAFGLREPILDGNVARLLCRVFRIHGDLRRSEAQDALWSLARDALPRREAGPFNQALMEMGAVVCLPRVPDCLRCPVAEACLAREEGLENVLPERRPSRPLPKKEVAAGLVLHGGRLLLHRRAAAAMLGGLWELPGGTILPEESPEQAVARTVRKDTGVSVLPGIPALSVEHAYSHFRITMHICPCEVVGAAGSIFEDCRWVLPEELETCPLPGADRKALQRLKEEGWFEKDRPRPIRGATEPERRP